MSATGQRWQSVSAHDALILQRSRAAEAAKRAGFVDRQVTMPSGEPLSFLERPPVGGKATSVVVFLHGMTNDRIMSASCFAKAAAELPDARCLLPDAPGHGGRMQWAMRPSFYPTLSADEHVDDFKTVLQVMLETESVSSNGNATCVQREQENFAPLDLIGYSMGGSTAFRFAAQHPHRIRNIALLAPALMIHDQLVMATAAAAQSGKLEDIIYNFQTIDEALEMCELVGWPATTAAKLGEAAFM